MTDVAYRIVEHDGGWAYKVGDVFSETFPSHAEAERMAKQAAGEQQSRVTTKPSNGRTTRANGTKKPKAAPIARRPASTRADERRSGAKRSAAST